VVERIKVTAVVPELETVVILHGIVRTDRSMADLAGALTANGYDVRNIRYPSTEMSIDDLAAYLRENYLTDGFWQDAHKVHFVVHSMGGLLTKRHLHTYRNVIPSEKLGRVVMIGTPLGGSEISNWLRGIWLYKKIFGPAGQELTTHARAKDQSEIYYDVGVIAGSRSSPHYFGRLFLPGPNDGRVSVARTRHSRIRDHHIVPVSHNQLLQNSEVQAQTLSFLKTGKFS